MEYRNEMGAIRGIPNYLPFRPIFELVLNLMCKKSPQRVGFNQFLGLGKMLVYLAIRGIPNALSYFGLRVTV